MSDQFWFKKPEILFSKQNMTQFWPSKYQTYEERVNAMTRFILYSGIIMSFYKQNTNPLVMAILLVSILVVISNSKNKVLKNILKNTGVYSDCQLPTAQNPLGNQIPYDDVTRKSACDADSVQDDITKSLFAEFPTRGLGDKNKEFVERQFFSTPNTGLVNDQSGFAAWLYGEPNRKMCKSDPSACTGFEGMQNGNSKSS